MSETIKCDCCGEVFSNEIPDDTIEFWEIENKYLCWNCKNQLGLTDCCDCGNDMYRKDNEFDLDLCPKCLEKWKAKKSKQNSNEHRNISS